MVRLMSFLAATLGIISMTGCGSTTDQVKQATSSKLASSSSGGTGTCAVRAQTAIKLMRECNTNVEILNTESVDDLSPSIDGNDPEKNSETIICER